MSGDTGGSAFPIVTLGRDAEFNGMTLQDWYRGMALQGLLANSALDTRDHDGLCRRAQAYGDKLVERSFGAMTIADAEYVPSEEMITAYLRAQHQYCHEADQRGEVEYSRKACVAGLKAALRSRN